MSIKVTLGVNRKIGQPNFGSRGASCHVEFELPAPLDPDDSSRFQTTVAQAYRACRMAVLRELGGESKEKCLISSEQTPSGSVMGQPARRERPATSNQLNAIQSMANRFRVNLDRVLKDQFQVNDVSQLTTRTASQLIERLQQIGAAQITSGQDSAVPDSTACATASAHP